MNRRVSSFFDSAFLEGFGARELYKVFEKYSEVDEVVIPAKKDIRGNRYGFVCFFDVEYKRLLAIKLDSIYLEERKIRVNVPRFSRRVGDIHGLMASSEERKAFGGARWEPRGKGLYSKENEHTVGRLKSVIIRERNQSFAQVV